MGAITDTVTDTVTVTDSATDTATDILMADTTDTMATISANDPPMPKLHLKPKLMPMPPHTTTAITDMATDTDITDTVTDSAMADTTDITDIPILMVTDMPTISANVTPKLMPPQLPMPMLMPPPFSTELIADITDILMLMELIPHTTPDIMPPMP